MLERSQKVIGLTDYSKFGVSAMNEVCPLSRLDVLITDSRADRMIIGKMHTMKTEVIQIEAPGEQPDTEQ